MIRGVAIIFGFLFLGEAVSSLLRLPVPGNVIGMVLLTIALKLKAVKLEWVKPVADFLVNNMSFLFVPAGVGIMAYFDIVQKQWLPIAVSIFVSTVFVLLCTGLIQQGMIGLMHGTNGKEKGGRA